MSRRASSASTPAGNIVGGLAERWNVSDDGLSYIFRLAAGEWPDGRKITAQQVARLLKRQIAPRSRNPLKDALGAVEDVVAMTDRVIEIRLRRAAPQSARAAGPAGVRDPARRRMGTGPFQPVRAPSARRRLRLIREIVGARR